MSAKVDVGMMRRQRSSLKRRGRRGRRHRYDGQIVWQVGAQLYSSNVHVESESETETQRDRQVSGQGAHPCEPFH